ncbi:two-component system, OmpR family, sensor histidine kinase RstB [Kutzneria sp. 744]|nr:two-component system, OmpR family, sensor histidine kinase RstB [Kutzneria sp. 744]
MRASAHADRTVIEVLDEGPGIAAADRDRVFERFTRGERSGDGGTGLGLAIARWVVDLHGGTIAVVDPDRGGCRIKVTLPAL